MTILNGQYALSLALDQKSDDELAEAKSRTRDFLNKFIFEVNEAHRKDTFHPCAAIVLCASIHEDGAPCLLLGGSAGDAPEIKALYQILSEHLNSQVVSTILH